MTVSDLDEARARRQHPSGKVFMRVPSPHSRDPILHDVVRVERRQVALAWLLAVTDVLVLFLLWLVVSR